MPDIPSTQPPTVITPITAPAETRTHLERIVDDALADPALATLISNTGKTALRGLLTRSRLANANELITAVALQEPSDAPA